ncbi:MULTISPECIES: histidine triad nucleotide-binding protein [Tissierellales]|uniref:Histidine triad nucleotide-binding protein n=1 Tax=Acidilutibacter cellobiosedens TaxID=2507161 RepID=A0A410QDU3_9FIRM|nr:MULTISPECIES: histidine triad nucleotide-binding protein [Tissierellales]MBE6081316.1 histidine triad nucleotide-binding protein [Tissierellaceae bacterium]QAT62155.1 histidine triad nucleotide-binding protein [Acidilutibacter cellobiosedens]SCL84444.1 HIT-like protein [Sporanaerobacter sp. PP17-6a]
MKNCIFCKIASGEVPSDIIYEDDKVVAFNDLNPQSPVHFLVIPKEHISSIKDINEENISIISHIFLVIKKIAHEKLLDEKGYRIVNNCGEFGGQSVDHLHFHVLGGREMLWPPG